MRAQPVRTDSPRVPGFGTSGLRGRVSELTQERVSAYVAAFLRACPFGAGLYVGRDLRASSARIAAMVHATALEHGVDVFDCGTVPTPALALAAQNAGAAAIMVTGSHIDADRNGLKFYTPQGEITKLQETAIQTAIGVHDPPDCSELGILRQADPGDAYCNRYVEAFGPQALSGRRIGVWSQTAVGRDLLANTLMRLGADVVELDRRHDFMALDTEAIPPDTRAFLTRICAGQTLDAVVSTDADGDRPLVADHAGRVIPGDLLGHLTARFLKAEVVVTPITSNSAIQREGFARVVPTRVGAPHVIAAMQSVQASEPKARVVGYEANGGFLLGFDAHCSVSGMPALMTRDSMLPIVAALVMAGEAGGLATCVARLPARFTATDKLRHVSPANGQNLLEQFAHQRASRACLLAQLSEHALDIDTSDGVRMALKSGRVLHLRQSGNAPELRIYAEAESRQAAERLLQAAMTRLRADLAQN